MGRGLSPCQQIPLTMVHLEGKEKKRLCYSQIPQTALAAASVHLIIELCRNKQARGTEKDVGAIVSCLVSLHDQV